MGKKTRNQKIRARTRTRPTIADDCDCDCTPAEHALAERHYRRLDACLAAEARGDARTALAVLRDSMLVNTRNMQRPLKELIRLGPDLPSWVAGRWLANQAFRWMLSEDDPRLDIAAHRAIGVSWLVETNDLRRPHDSALAEHVKVTDSVCHQIALYDLDGLADYLEVRAGKELIAQCPGVEFWPETSVGGYELLTADDDVATVRDVLLGTEKQVHNLGFATGIPTGTLYFGRLVPVVEEPGLIFDVPPIEVDAEAIEIFRRFGGNDGPPSWLVGLTNSIANGRLPLAVTATGMPRFTTDL